MNKTLELLEARHEEVSARQKSEKASGDVTAETISYQLAVEIRRLILLARDDRINFCGGDTTVKTLEIIEKF